MIEPVVDLAWLDAHRAGVLLADVRWALAGPPGRESFEAAHVPGAVFVDLDAQLAAPATDADGRHPLPTPAAFADAMGSVGIGDDTVVVAYDDSAGSSAARLVWMLRVLGREAALLDGGLRGWTARHGAEALETGPSEPSPRTFTETPWPAALIVDADAVAALADGPTVVLDARDHGRFTGERPAPVDARPGHVPGAANAPWQANLDAEGAFLPPEVLRANYEALGVGTGEDAEPPVLYCGSGVTASLDLLALERAGVEGARLYPGSWSQWAADPSRPVETGEARPRNG